MTCARDILDEEGLEREFNSIRNFFKDLGREEKPLRIEWGTKEAMEKAETALLSEDKIIVKAAFAAGVLAAKASEFRSQNLEVAAEWIEEIIKTFFDALDMKPPVLRHLQPRKSGKE